MKKFLTLALSSILTFPLFAAIQDDSSKVVTKVEEQLIEDNNVTSNPEKENSSIADTQKKEDSIISHEENSDIAS